MAKEASTSNTKPHVGNIVEISVGKNRELPPNDPARKFKGRVVFEGNQVWDESRDVALFHELGSTPAPWRQAEPVTPTTSYVATTFGRPTLNKPTSKAKLDRDVMTSVRLSPERRPKASKTHA